MQVSHLHEQHPSGGAEVVGEGVPGAWNPCSFHTRQGTLAAGVGSHGKLLSQDTACGLSPLWGGRSGEEMVILRLGHHEKGAWPESRLVSVATWGHMCDE